MRTQTATLLILAAGLMVPGAIAPEVSPDDVMIVVDSAVATVQDAREKLPDAGEAADGLMENAATVGDWCCDWCRNVIRNSCGSAGGQGYCGIRSNGNCRCTYWCNEPREAINDLQV